MDNTVQIFVSGLTSSSVRICFDVSKNCTIKKLRKLVKKGFNSGCN
jgi:hypothetical protein